MPETTHYDRLSPLYDAVAGWAERPLTRLAVSILKPKPGERLLDVGCGTGTALVELARAVGASGGATGLDLSKGMLTQARKRCAKERDLAACFELVEGDARSLPFEAERFDGILFSFSLELLGTADRRRALLEARRVLRPSGRLVVVALVETPNPRLGERFYGWLHEHFPQLFDCHPIAVETEIAAAGFEVDAARTTLWGLPVAIATAYRQPIS